MESYLWVKRCIDKGQVIYTPVVYKNPGGRRPGEEYASTSIPVMVWSLTWWQTYTIY